MPADLPLGIFGFRIDLRARTSKDRGDVRPIPGREVAEAKFKARSGIIERHLFQFQHRLTERRLKTTAPCRRAG